MSAVLALIAPEATLRATDPEEPERFAVELEEDIIGAGSTPMRALREASDQILKWDTYVLLRDLFRLSNPELKA